MKTTLMVLLLAVSSLAWGEDKLPLPNSGNVTLTLDEYNKLVELAAKPPHKLDISPLPYSIKRAGLKLRVDSNTVLGTVQLDGEVFHKGVSKVPLTTGMTILDAHQGAKGVPLQQENGTHTALLAGPAEFSVALDTGLPLRIEAGRASFSLPVPTAGSVQLTLVVPGDHTFVNLTPGVITSRKSEGGHTSIEATLIPGQSTSVWWATRETTPVVPREVRFLADVKTLVSVSEADLRIAALADITVVQGEPAQFQIELPSGYEVTGVTGASLDSSDTQQHVLTLKVNAATQRTHQFLISMERSIAGTKAEAPFLAFKAAQRETGEVLVEGVGTMELTATEAGGLKRMDVKETNPYLRSLAHYPPQAAFRYHKQPNETPTLALDWVRFPDSSVLAAVAESAVVTTMVTSEGRSLTEVRLTLKNQAQPFLKVTLPAGASILSADVAGERVKPVQGPDGNRVPLLRPGFRPTSSYTVSFVFLHSGAPFAKKGGAELTLPNMDVPISLVQWEVFLPEQYKVKDFGGNVIAANLVAPAFREGDLAMNGRNFGAFERLNVSRDLESLAPGQVGGYVTDPTGAVVPNAQVTATSTASGLTRTAVTDLQGRWLIDGLPSGPLHIKAEMPGFNTSALNLNYDANRPAAYALTMNVAAATETIEVTADSTSVQASEVRSLPLRGRNYDRLEKFVPGVMNQNAASANVMNLQKRVAGVLPVAIEVPRAGTSFAFVRPLVLDEETKVTFTYKSR